MTVVESSPATMESVKLDLRFTGDTRVEPGSALESQICDKFVAARQKQLERFNDPDFDLPSMPPCVVKVMEISQSPDPSLRALENVLQMDQALAAKILRMANSPIYGGTRRIDSLQSAINRLGVVSIRNVVLAIAVNSTIKSAAKIGPVANVLWEHSIATGIASQVLARAGLPRISNTWTRRSTCVALSSPWASKAFFSSGNVAAFADFLHTFTDCFSAK